MDAGRVLFAGGHAPPALQSWAAASGRSLDVTLAGTAGLEHFLAHPAGLVIAVIHMETMGDLAALARLRELPAGRDVPLIVLCRPPEVERIARFTEPLRPLAVLPEPIDITRLSELHPTTSVASPADVVSDPLAADVSVRPRAQRGAAAPPPEDTRARRGVAPAAEPDIEIAVGRRSRVPVADEVVVRRRPSVEPDVSSVRPRSTTPATPEVVLPPSPRATRTSASAGPVGMPSDELRTRMRELGKQNNFERLGVSLSATQSDVDGAFEAVTARLQPECYRDPSDVAMAEGLLKAIRLAYGTLHTPHKRAEYASRLSAIRSKPTEPTRPALNTAFSDLLAEAERASEAAMIQSPPPPPEAPPIAAAAPETPLVAEVAAPMDPPTPRLEEALPASPPAPAGGSTGSAVAASKEETDAAPIPTTLAPSPRDDSAAATAAPFAAPVGAEETEASDELPSFDDVDAIFGGDLDWSAALPQPTADTSTAKVAGRPTSKERLEEAGPATQTSEAIDDAPESESKPTRVDRLAPKPLDRPRKTPSEALEAGPRDWIVEARYLLFIGDHTRAMTLLDACLAAEPNIRRYHYYRGLALGRAHAVGGRFAEARKALEDAVRYAGSGQTEAAQALQELAQVERRRA
jgi:CheY-like chemotaxis protein